jgi:hypothetical protein
VEDIIGESYFMPLFDRVLGRLIQISTLQEGEAKKSEQLQPAITSDASPQPTSSPGS